MLLVNTGNGKGKSSAGFGLVARALGHGMQVGVVQFIKGRSDTGEEAFFRTQPGVTWHVMGEGFTWETQDRARDVAAAEAAWAVAREMLQNPDLGLVVLDELNIALKYQYLDADRVVADLRARPRMQHVVVTGRGAPPALASPIIQNSIDITRVSGASASISDTAAPQPAATMTPVSSKRVCVQLPSPWARPNTTTIAVSAPTKAEASTQNVAAPSVIAPNAATAAPPEMPRM